MGCWSRTWLIGAAAAVGALPLLLACPLAVDEDAGLSCVPVLGRFPVLLLLGSGFSWW